MPQDVVFLLGAGVSLAAGMPSTKELTCAAFSDTMHLRNGDYYPGDYPQPDEVLRRLAREQVDAVRWFLAYAGSLIARYRAQFNDTRAPTYEDLYFLVGQIADDAQGQVDNPLTLLFSEQAEQAFRTVIDDFNGKPFPSGHWSAARLALEAVKLIQGMVAGKLWSPAAQPVKKIGALLHEAYADPRVRRMHVFTLNHDRVLEAYFAAHGIAFEDGFEPKAIKGLCVRRPERYDASLHKVHLYKLHGSVDWHYNFRERVLGRVIDYAACRDIDDSPEMLLGTFNKILAYQHPHYLDLHTRFRAALRACGRLVVSGYSFGDQAINSRIVEALDSNPRRAKAVIIHRDLDALHDGARGAIRKNWDRWKTTHQFDFVKRWFQVAAWEEVAAKLAEPPEPEKWRPKTQQESFDDDIRDLVP